MSRVVAFVNATNPLTMLHMEKLNSFGIPSQNWESISMDFITDLPISHGFDMLLVIVD